MIGSMMNDAKVDQVKQLISFTVGEVEYGMELLRVKEVIRVGAITRMPRAPVFLKGVINLRGEIIPVIDLGERFGLPPRANSETTRLIVAEIGEKSVGLLVDGVSHVMRIALDEIDSEPVWRDWLTRTFVSGVARVDDRLVVLLDMDGLLSADELADMDAGSGSTGDGESRDAMHEIVQ